MSVFGLFIDFYHSGNVHLGPRLYTRGQAAAIPRTTGPWQSVYPLLG